MALKLNISSHPPIFSNLRLPLALCHFYLLIQNDTPAFLPFSNLIRPLGISKHICLYSFHVYSEWTFASCYLHELVISKTRHIPSDNPRSAPDNEIVVKLGMSWHIHLCSLSGQYETTLTSCYFHSRYSLFCPFLKQDDFRIDISRHPPFPFTWVIWDDHLRVTFTRVIPPSDWSTLL